jgi:DNA polymerase III sliding clamp (beta) subunit (PCNA family)
VENNAVVLSARGEISEYQVLLKAEEGNLINPVLKEGSRASYDLKRLGSIVSSLLFSENLKLEFDTDLPMRVMQSIEEAPNSTVVFFIAPRMEKA